MGRPAIYYVPHADDETLSMAVDILQHVEAGREIIIVLYTDGTGSFVHDALNGQQDSRYWGGYHDPAIEGYQLLSDEDFSNAWTREFESALGQLGVKPENIHLRFVNQDGYSYDKVKDLVREYEARYPTAGHKAMSYYDSSYTHADSGRALNELYNDGVITDARFFIARADWADLQPGWIISANDEQKVKIRRAARCYEAWNPSAGSFAIGYHSVSDQFDAMVAIPQNKVHRPNE